MRVIVKTTADITANLEADRIEEAESFLKAYNGKELVGLFDVGSVLFMYKTQTTTKEKTWK